MVSCEGPRCSVYHISCGLDLAGGYLLLDVVEHHQEVFAFLGEADFRVGEGHYGAVVFHNVGWEFKRDLQFLT